MRYVVGFMMLAFLGGGLMLLVAAAKVLGLRLRRRTHLERVEGRVVEVQRETRFSQGTGRGRSRPTQVNFPVVTFRRPSGEVVTFKSDVGDAGESRFAVGQSVAVLYDPGGELAPLIGSGTGPVGGLWYIPLTLALGGLAFIGGGLMTWLAFGEQILGR